jgi:5-(carboxyamino)imidazole ribonucleotide mutase
MKVALVIGSKSDKDLGDKALEVLKEFGLDYDYKVISAHRNPASLVDYVENCDADLFIAIAGLAAALPGAIAALTIKPVIGVPKDVRLGGLDSLLSMVQMPPGIPVATVAIDNPRNAALLAVSILALKDDDLKQKLLAYRKKLAG